MEQPGPQLPQGASQRPRAVTVVFAISVYGAKLVPVRRLVWMQYRRCHGRLQAHPSDAVTSFPFECHVYTVLAQGGVLMSYCSLLHVIPNTLLPFRPEID
jgi:hypothetical protein